MSESTAAIFAAFIAAFAAIWIGWLQYRALRQQNRIAAFDRRFEAFLNVQAAIERAFREKPAELQHIFELNRALRVCWFIFPKALSARLRKIRETLVELRALRVTNWDDAGYQRETAPAEAMSQYHTAQRLIVEEWESLQDTFHPYMNFDH